MNEVVYIYVLEDPNTNQVRYVGQTVTPDIRLNTHRSLSRTGASNSKLAVWIRHLLDKDQAPIMRIIEVVDTAQKATEREQYWLDEFRAKGTKLVNSREVKLEERPRRRRTRSPKQGKRPQFLLRFHDGQVKTEAEKWVDRLGYGSLNEYILEAITWFIQQQEK